MARTITVIKNEIQTTVRTYPSLNSYLFPEEGGSKVSIFNLIIATIAQSVFVLETLIDAAISTMQAIAAATPVGNAQWLQQQMLKFQYGDVIVFVNNVPAYNPVNLTHLLITQCSVTQLSSGTVAIKVAKGTIGALAPLSAAELSAVVDYYFGTSMSQGIGFAGVRAQFVNLNPDRLRVQATIYFYGQYVQATVLAAVIAAINGFLNNFSVVDFGGTVKIIKLVDAIQVVPGVSRVTITDIKARQATVPLGSATTIDVQGYYPTVSGYIISEDTAANTLTDTITMTQETI